jgi:hypothetical protein
MSGSHPAAGEGDCESLYSGEASSTRIECPTPCSGETSVVRGGKGGREGSPLGSENTSVGVREGDLASLESGRASSNKWDFVDMYFSL